MQTLFEIRIPGARSAPAQLQTLLHTQLRQLPTGAVLQRLELRYSSRAAVPFQRDAVRQALRALLHQKQLEVPDSIRPHCEPGSRAGAIDDATGEHVMRGLGEQVPQESWMARLLRTWRPAVAAVTAAPAQEPEFTEALPVAQAVTLLRQAVADAARHPVAEDGSAASGSMVCEARVTVRQAALHHVLHTLVPQDPQSLASMVQAAGLATAERFAVQYRFEPDLDGDGTGMAGRADLEVRLVLGTEAGPAPKAPDEARGGVTTALPGSATSSIASGTAPAPLPDATALPHRRRGVRVRIVGTLHEAFAQPFELHLSTLPARVDRRTLEQAGFGRAHGLLLSVLSNRCPIELERGPDGRTVARFGLRRDGAQSQPMYRDGRTLAVLSGEQPLELLPPTLVVNDPEGVVEPTSGTVLPALRLQLMAA